MLIFHFFEPFVEILGVSSHITNDNYDQSTRYVEEIGIT